MTTSTPATVTVQVNPDRVSPRRGRTEHADEVPELRSLAQELGIAFRPLHPGTDDRTLRTYFVVDVRDYAEAERLAERLRQSPVIAAAYVKPPDAMP